MLQRSIYLLFLCQEPFSDPSCNKGYSFFLSGVNSAVDSLSIPATSSYPLPFSLAGQEVINLASFADPKPAETNLFSPSWKGLVGQGEILGCFLGTSALHQSVHWSIGHAPCGESRQAYPQAVMPPPDFASSSCPFSCCLGQELESRGL